MRLRLGRPANGVKRHITPPPPFGPISVPYLKGLNFFLNRL